MTHHLLTEARFPHQTRSALPLALVIVCLVALAACGGDPGTSTDDSQPAAAKGTTSEAAGEEGNGSQPAKGPSFSTNQAPTGSWPDYAAIIPFISQWAAPIASDDDAATDGPAPQPPTPAMEAALARFLNRDLPESTRLGNQISAEIPFLWDQEGTTALATRLLDQSETETIRHECANLLREAGVDELPGLLVTILHRQEESDRFRGFAMQHLAFCCTDPAPGWTPPTAEITAVLELGLAADPHLPVRREALKGLLDSGHAPTMQRLAALLDDPVYDPLADQIIASLQRFDRREALPAIRAQLRSDDRLTQLAAVNALGRFADTESAGEIRRLAGLDDPQMQRTCQLALQRIGAANP